MKKLLLLSALACMSGILFAGGIVTNTNQSASWIRMPAQDASVGIEAVYYNPAGLMKLKNGFHVSLSNQTIYQTKTVENSYKGPGDAFGLKKSSFGGKATAPFYPGFYAVYKMDKFAFSFGLTPVGGGGTATFDDGLPAFEMPVSDLVPSLASQGVNDYRMDAYLEGTSFYLGYQGSVSYKINDMVSVSAGLRFVSAKNTYMGHLSGVEVFNFGGGAAWTPAHLIMTGIADNAAGGASQLQAAITGGILQANDPVSPLFAGSLALFGVDATGLTNQQAVGAFQQVEKNYDGTAEVLKDQEVEVEQTGSGITPVFGVNISPNDRLNVGIKYELATKMELTNKTTKDFLTGFAADGSPVTMFPDGDDIHNDMPAFLSLGASYKATDKLSIHAGGHYFFDKSVNYGKKLGGVYVKNDKLIDKNSSEIAMGLEYSLSDKLLVSCGYLRTNSPVKEEYQSDLSYTTSSNSGFAGLKLQVNEMVGIDFGLGYSKYVDGEKTINHVFSATGATIPVTEIYKKKNLFMALGVGLSF